MLIEILAEDKSGSVVVKKLTEQLVNAAGIEATVNVRPHRGCGSLPKDMKAHPQRFSGSLLDLLPAKCRAYNRVFKDTDSILVVVMDSDDHNPEDLKNKLKMVTDTYAPDVKHVIGLCTEEIEAWLLGDEEAIKYAYPDYDKTALKNYVQDSICGTWETLCKVVCPEDFEDIIDIGYPAIGNYKARWAEEISEYMFFSNNVSPSFIQYKTDLLQKLK